VAADAERDEQSLFIITIAMMNQQLCDVTTYSTAKPVSLEHRFTQSAKEAQGMVASVITSATATETL
jgi:hypothetical protein